MGGAANGPFCRQAQLRHNPYPAGAVADAPASGRRPSLSVDMCYVNVTRRLCFLWPDRAAFLGSWKTRLKPPAAASSTHLHAAMVGLTAAQLPPMKLYAGDTITYHTQMYVAGDSRGSRTAVVTRVDDSPGEADAPIKVMTDEIIPPTMMIKKVIDRDGEEVRCHWRKLRTYELVPGEFEAPSDRTRFAQAVQTIITAAFTGQRDVGPAEEEVVPRMTPTSADNDQAQSVTSSVATAAAADVAHGLVDAHESQEEAEYEVKVPVPAQTTSVTRPKNTKQTAVSTQARTPRGGSAGPASRPKARVAPGQGHPSEETSETSARKPPAKKVKTSPCQKAKTTSSSRWNWQLPPAQVPPAWRRPRWAWSTRGIPQIQPSRRRLHGDVVWIGPDDC
jgi:hypothetical protein